MCCVHQKHNFVHHCFHGEISDQCQQGLPVSGSLALAETHSYFWQNDILSLFVKSLASFLPAGAKLGWMDGCRRWRCKEEGKGEAWETFMYYVRNIQHSVFRIRWCRTTLALPLTHLAPFVLILWAFSGAFSRSHPPSPAHLGHTDLAKGLRRGEIENKREGGKQTEGQLKEPGLNRRAKRGYVNTGCVVNSTSFLSSIQFQSLVLFIEANVCVFFIHPWIAGEEMQNF